MQMSKFKPQKISIQEFMSFLEKPFEPVYGLSIPNILIPDELSGKKKYQDTKTFVVSNIRQMFNSLTKDNISTVKENLRILIIEKAKNVELLDEIAKEFLSNFIVSYQNIENYMHLLNAVSSACILLQTTDKKVSPTIGNMFLEKCKILIFTNIKEDNIRSLASLDLDDDEDLDKYNKERDKINNLIITICYLYGQRNNTRGINLTIFHVYPLMNIIMKSFQKVIDQMKKLGNPYEDEECENEVEYEILSKMATLYAEQLYIFISEQGKEFLNDPAILEGNTLKSLVIKFKNDIFPKIKESFLISKCEILLANLNIK